MKQALLIILTIAFLIAATGMLAAPKTKQVERAYPGYIADLESGQAGMNPDGKDIVQNPALYTREHMQNRMDSGYGVFLRTKKGNFKFYKLDETGSSMVRNEILPNTKRTENIYVVVKGSIDKDGIIKTSWIKEVANGSEKSHAMEQKKDNEMNKEKERDREKELERELQNQGKADQKKGKGKN